MPVLLHRVPPLQRASLLSVDTRTEMTENAIKKSIENVGPTLRTLERAPPTRELMELHYRYASDQAFSPLIHSFRQKEGGALSFFRLPNASGLGDELTSLITRTMATREQFELPQSTFAPCQFLHLLFVPVSYTFRRIG